MLKLPRVKPGDDIAAEHVTAIYEALAWLDEQAEALRRGEPGDRMAIKLTGARSGAAYAWRQQIEQDDGTWTDGTLSGTTADDPVWEVSGNTAVPLSPAPIVYAWRDPLGGLLVQIGSC